MSKRGLNLCHRCFGSSGVGPLSVFARLFTERSWSEVSVKPLSRSSSCVPCPPPLSVKYSSQAGSRRAFRLLSPRASVTRKLRGYFADLYPRLVNIHPLFNYPSQKICPRAAPSCPHPLHLRTRLGVHLLRNWLTVVKHVPLGPTGQHLVDWVMVMGYSPPLTKWLEIYCHLTSAAPR